MNDVPIEDDFMMKGRSFNEKNNFVDNVCSVNLIIWYGYQSSKCVE